MVQAAARNSDATRERLLRVASHMYQKDGYEATNLRRVAKELGISGPAIYHHFRSKDELLVTAYTERIERMISAHEQIQSDLGSAEDLWAWTALHVRLQIMPNHDGPHMFGASQLLTLISPEERKPLYKVMREYLDELVQIIEVGIKAKEFDKVNSNALAFAIFGMDHHIPQWYSPRGDVSAEELSELYADLALRMAGAKPIRSRARLRRLVNDALRSTNVGDWLLVDEARESDGPE